MDVVRQAHLPGNYELYDEESGGLGPPICKFCWEKDHARNTSSLDTVWLSLDGWNVVWWVCKGHHAGMGTGDPSMIILKSETSLVRNPMIGK